jgi:ribonucleotide reductase alpha subunit
MSENTELVDKSLEILKDRLKGEDIGIDNIMKIVKLSMEVVEVTAAGKYKIADKMALIKNKKGEVLRENRDKEIFLPFNSEYSLLIKNNNNKRLHVPL